MIFKVLSNPTHSLILLLLIAVVIISISGSNTITATTTTTTTTINFPQANAIETYHSIYKIFASRRGIAGV